MRSMSRSYRALAPLLLLALGALSCQGHKCSAAVTPPSLQILSQSGDVMPASGRPITGFYILGSPVLNESGQVAVVATSGDSIGNPGYTSVLRVSQNEMIELVYTGQAAPDNNGTLSDYRPKYPSMNDAGQVAIRAVYENISGGGANQAAILVGDEQGLSQVYRTGYPTPDGVGEFYSIYYEPTINNQGRVAVIANFKPTPDQEKINGLFQAGNPTNELIVATDTPSPDGNGQFYTTGIGFDNATSNPAMNDQGDIFFYGRMYNLDVGTTERSILLSGGASPLSVVARGGEQAGDVNRTFVTMGLPGYNTQVITDTGVMAFGAVTEGDSSLDSHGIFRIDGSGLLRIAAEGQTLPNSLKKFGRMNPPRANDLGDVAFTSWIKFEDGSGSSDAGLFLYKDRLGQLIEIVQHDQPALNGNGTIKSVSVPALNNKGQMVFMVRLQDTAGGNTDNVAIYFYDPKAGLIPVMRYGDTILGSTVVDLDISLMSENMADGLNDRGQVAFAAALADGNQFVGLWTVPEPASLGIFVALLLLNPMRPDRRDLTNPRPGTKRFRQA